MLAYMAGLWVQPRAVAWGPCFSPEHPPSFWLAFSLEFLFTEKGLGKSLRVRITWSPVPASHILSCA